MTCKSPAPFYRSDNLPIRVKTLEDKMTVHSINYTTIRKYEDVMLE